MFQGIPPSVLPSYYYSDCVLVADDVPADDHDHLVEQNILVVLVLVLVLVVCSNPVQE